MKRRSVPMLGLLAAVVPLAPLGAWAADASTAISLAQQSADQWRASKLVGLSVYGPDDKSVGKITDVLIGKDGRAQDIVVGVGGFLGIGEKDVAIPFAAVAFSDKPMNPPATGAPGGTNLGAPTPGMNPPGTVAPAAGFVAPAASPGAPADLTNNGATPVPAMMQHSTAYPDHAVIAFNKDQLTSAPAFQFAK